ncbi:hypothetical protein [Aminirod propionatiphilus]|uniref:Uncharacterized protein n=1 Tax=Aminirod propionatiphilus TaxID=3415223 RepID=A0ACD1DXY7_9BACT|nr:hypothetical protein KIH16_04505 [Synergistota bacterium]
MPKTHNGLWPLIYDFGNLYQAFLRASKNKRYKPDVLRFAERLEENLIILQNELIWKCWEPLPARQFEILEPKRRLIRAPVFRDRIIHHAVVGAIQPFFDRKMLANSFACRAGKGTHAAVCAACQMLRSARREHGRYSVLKGDIHLFFWCLAIYRDPCDSFLGLSVVCRRLGK